jgi:hypothetical protein
MPSRFDLSANPLKLRGKLLLDRFEPLPQARGELGVRPAQLLDLVPVLVEGLAVDVIGRRDEFGVRPSGARAAAAEMLSSSSS